MYKLVEEASKVLRTPPEVFDFENPPESPELIAEKMSEAMDRFGGMGLSANQVGLPYRMFVAGGHPQIENGLSIAMYNPEIVSASVEEVSYKEGCLSFPFIFLDIKRPKECVMKYTDSDGKEQEAHLKGMMARICLHEFDHMQGLVFTEKVSKFRLQRAKEKGQKMMKQMKKRQKQNQA